MNDNDIKLVSERLQSVDTLTPVDAELIARELLSYDDDIVQATIEWARSGVMPANPLVEGYTPQSLDEKYLPSQVFGLLALLRSSPGDAARALRWMPGRSSPPRVPPST